MDQISPGPFDMILRGGRVIDPAQGLDGIADVAIRGGRIAAVAPSVTGPAKEVLDVRGRLVLPGMIDTHAHVYRYVSGRFGLDADMVGVHSGVTTVVDQGGPSVLTFPAFREYAARPMATRVLAFISAYMVGGLEGHYYPELYRPDCIAVDDTVRVARENADLVRGVKGHAESAASPAGATAPCARPPPSPARSTGRCTSISASSGSCPRAPTNPTTRTRSCPR